jgi:hypothetical protein
MPRNYNERILVAVDTKIKTTMIKYGFKTGIKTEADRVLLGQVEVAALPTATGLVLGCNNPKPNKATKKDTITASGVTTYTGGSKTSFIATAKIEDALFEGWLVKGAPEPRNPIGAKYVTINGIKYGWNPQTLPSGVTAPAGDTGVKDGDVNDVLCFGCQFPKPARMKTTFGVGNSYSSFVDPDKINGLRTSGWDRAGKTLVSLAIINTKPPASDPPPADG